MPYVCFIYEMGTNVVSWFGVRTDNNGQQQCVVGNSAIILVPRAHGRPSEGRSGGNRRSPGATKLTRPMVTWIEDLILF